MTDTEEYTEMMHILLLLILIIVSGFASAMLAVEYMTEGAVPWKWRIISWASFIILTAWCILSYHQPLRFEKEFVCAIGELQNSDGSVTQFVTYDGKVINLNAEMGGMVPKGAKVKVSIPAHGPYLGVYWGMQGDRSSPCMKHIYTVVE